MHIDKVGITPFSLNKHWTTALGFKPHGDELARALKPEGG